MDSLPQLIMILLLVFMNGFFVAAEFAAVKIRKSRVETLVLEGNNIAKYTEKIINDLNSYLSACQLGITLSSLGLGWIGESTISRLLEPILELFKLSSVTLHSISIMLSFIIITSLHIILGELVPKSIAIITTERVALLTSIPLILFYKITYPVIWIFNQSTNCILRVFRIKSPNEHDIAHTNEEIKILAAESYKHGLIDKTELTFVDNIFDFSEKTVKDIMIPRIDMICINGKEDFDKIINMTMTEQITRYPVYENSKDNIIGFVHIKDLYRHVIIGNKDIHSITRNIVTVPKCTPISDLLKIFKTEKEQLAIVIDEYGGTSGMVTFEDILEEIVGEIQDEFDEDGEEEIKTLEDGSFMIDGKVLIEEINELLNIDIDDEDIDTIGGWVYFKLNGNPQVDNKVQYDGYDFIVVKASEKRVVDILIKSIIEE